MAKREKLPPSEQAAVLKEATKRMDLPTRRLFFKSAAGLGTLAAVTGVAIVNGASAEKVLKQMSYFNDRFQAWLFDPNKMAPEFTEADIIKPFPFNAFYAPKDAPEPDADYQLLVGGLIENKKPWTVAGLRDLPQASQITEHICIEGWSAVGKWSGVRVRDLLTRVGADMRAKYVTFNCFDRYSTQIDMASALHPQTILAIDFLDQPIPRIYGAPVRLKIPTKIGYKSAKHVYEVIVTNDFVEGYWERVGYNWFAGL